MADKMTPQEFAQKVEWEGGVLDALEYGLKADDLDDSPEATDLYAEWFELQDAWKKLQRLLEPVEARIEGLLLDQDEEAE
jgi:hypothetical protein